MWGGGEVGNENVTGFKAILRISVARLVISFHNNEPDVLSNQKTDPGSRGDHRLLVYDLHGISSGL